jgi:DNA-binding response OmpR family regulator
MVRGLLINSRKGLHMHKHKPRSVLIVDDDEALLEILAERLRMEGFEVWTACDGAHGYSCYSQRPTELVITDIQMPVLNGLDMMRYIRAINPFVKTIYVSGAVREFRASLEFEGQEFGAAVLDKPFSSEKLFTLIGCRPTDRAERERRF